MAATRIHHINFIVRDLDSAAADFERLLGLEPFELVDHAANGLVHEIDLRGIDLHASRLPFLVVGVFPGGNSFVARRRRCDIVPSTPPACSWRRFKGART